MSAVSREHEDLAAYVRDSLYISLVPLPAALLGAALLGDILYWVTADALYARGSDWLLAIGLSTGVLAAGDGLIRYVVAGSAGPTRTCWMHVIGNLFALLLSASNLVYRLNEDATNSVLPAGITLSAVVVCLLIATAYLGRGFVSNVPIDEADDDDWDLL
jgi:uncharacterized membrane protein